MAISTCWSEIAPATPVSGAGGPRSTVVVVAGTAVVVVGADVVVVVEEFGTRASSVVKVTGSGAAAAPLQAAATRLTRMIRTRILTVS